MAFLGKVSDTNEWWWVEEQLLLLSKHCDSFVLQMYSDGSEFLPQNNETALKYFKKASELVGTTLLCPIAPPLSEYNKKSSHFAGFAFIWAFLLLRVIPWARAASAWPTCMEEASQW